MFRKISILVVLCTIFGLTTGLGHADEVDVSATVPSSVGPGGGSSPGTSTPTVSGDIILSSTTHPNQKAWYSKDKIILKWNKPSNIAGFSYLLDHASKTGPDLISEGDKVSKQYDEVEDGVWYFHLRPLKPNGTTLEVLHFKIQLDLTPPEFEYVRFQEGDSTTDRTPALEFLAHDLTSGVDFFEYELDDKNFQKATSPVRVTRQEVGIHRASVRAYDLANNAAVGKTEIEILALESPKITKLSRIVGLFQNATISGTGPANTKIILFVSYRSNPQIIYEWKTNTDTDGDWEHTNHTYLRPGQYSVFARAYDEAGGESEKSNTENFLVSVGGIAMFGVIVPTWLLVSVLALTLVLLRYLLPYILQLLPTERSRVIVVGVMRAGELLLLEKHRKIRSDKPEYQLLSGKLKPGELEDQAVHRIVGEALGNNSLKIEKIMHFDTAEHDKKVPASIAIAHLGDSEIIPNRQAGYMGYWWTKPFKDESKYFPSIPDGIQKHSFVEIKNFLDKKQSK